MANRKYLIAGNWKMNKTAAEGVELAKAIVAAVGKETSVNVAVCPTFTSLDSVSKVVEGSNVVLGAQNMHPQAAGAYTGEISADMLRQFFVGYVILGHSERRQYFGETDAFVNEKTLAVLANNMRPILCVGETLEEREAGKTISLITAQVTAGLKDVKAEQAESVVVAYEPIWAIGTGKTATPAMAQEVHAAIRVQLKELFGAAQAEKVRILYGGSMKPSNAAELMSEPDIDGGLIGGAALEAKSFVELVEAAAKQA